MQPLNTIPLSSKFGVEVKDVNLSGPLADGVVSDMVKTLYEQGVMILRGQNLTIESFIAFSRRVGPLTIHPLKQFSKPGYPELMVNSNIVENGKPLGLADGGQDWHTDGAYIERPHRTTILYAVEVPVQEGVILGDTMFASTTWAYDSLSDAQKQRIAPLSAVHRHGVNRERRGAAVHIRGLGDPALGGVEHPLVRTHPHTGRKCLYVNEGSTAYVRDVSETESQDLINTLARHAVRQEYVYRHKWQVGDVVMWDNCSTQHCAIGDYKPPLRRLLYRTVVRGELTA